jgi:hypothetical protein
MAGGAILRGIGIRETAYPATSIQLKLKAQDKQQSVK